FFRMSAYADRLMKYIEDHPEFIEPESRKKEMVNNFLKAGLQDLCVSRTSFKWGIPVTFDDKHVIYVWIDALSNYITALGYDVDEKGELYGKYWPADVHIIGKDILRFHTIYWPIILMALGEPLPKKVFGHPWLLFGQDKMSKSKGNVLYADDLVKKFGVDGVRHYVLAEMPYNADGSITWETLISRYNSDLANNLGNLVNRTAAMTKKYFDGVVPEKGEEDELDRSLRETVEKAREDYFAQMDGYHIADAVESVFSALRRANKYIDETAPWVLAKSEETKPRLASVIYNLLETIRLCGTLLAPFMPGTAKSIAAQIGCGDQSYEYGALKAGTVLGESSPLFARIDEAKFYAELEAEKAEAEKQAAVPEKPEGLALIGIEDFMNVELRTAQVVECEPVPKAKKLLKLQLDLGYEKRQVVSGIAKFYTPDQLIGKKIIVVANLKPAKLCGVESNGMILASGEEEVRVVFLDPETPLGERVR
ncbi:MAG: methionine--tRNA ligase, partial [Clostridia bacterium]|nr:methionine--tRNA ligase [Clostridia bacterium]